MSVRIILPLKKRNTHKLSSYIFFLRNALISESGLVICALKTMCVYKKIFKKDRFNI